MSDILISFGFSVVSSLELQIATKTEKEKIYNHEKIIKAFNKFITRIEKGQINKPTLGQMVRFNIFKTMSEYNKEHFIADYQYYKDISDITSARKANFFKKLLAKWMVKKMMLDFAKNRL